MARGILGGYRGSGDATRRPTREPLRAGASQRSETRRDARSDAKAKITAMGGYRIVQRPEIKRYDPL